MSRSNPNENAPNPATRYFEWSGSKGVIRYYDKDAKQSIEVPDFTFMVLDELVTVRGWDDAADCGIFANMVRDTRVEPLEVRSKKSGILASGIYRAVKDRIEAAGGHFTAIIYLGFKQGGEIRTGMLQLKGAALMAWLNFRKEHRRDLYKSAVVITGFEEGKKGSVTFRVPTFALKPVSEETNQAAVALDADLQAWLSAYFAKATVDRVEPDHEAPPVSDHPAEFAGAITDDDIPF